MIASKKSRNRSFIQSLIRRSAECEALEARTMLSASVHIADYFPLANGNTWSFTGTDGADLASATGTQTSTANISEQGRLVTVLDLVATSGGQTREEKDYFAHTANGLRLFRTDVIGNSTVVTEITGGATVLPPDPVIGTPYTFTRNLTGTINSTTTFTGTTSGTVTLVGFEALTTGDGTYDALKETITQTYTDHLSNGSTTTGTNTKTEWLIKGIGYGRISVDDTSTNTVTGTKNTIYDLTLTDTPLATADPRLQVYGNSTKIANGDVTPRAIDNTAYGAVRVGRSVGHNFILTNTGSQALVLTPVSMSNYIAISGPAASDFSVVTQPGVTTLSPGQSTYFRVRFTPSATGSRLAVVTITSNSASNSTYSFDIRGTGFQVGAIDVTGGAGVHINNGAVSTSTTDGTRLGSVTTAGHHTLTSTFTIENTGLGTLNLTNNPLVSISGADASDFVVTVLPHASIVASDMTTFTITFDPSVKGFRKASVSIASSDPSKPLYTFSIAGTGV